MRSSDYFSATLKNKSQVSSGKNWCFKNLIKKKKKKGHPEYQLGLGFLYSSEAIQFLKKYQTRQDLLIGILLHRPAIHKKKKHTHKK